MASFVPPPKALTRGVCVSILSFQVAPPEKPAKTYPFTLDPFQQAAIGFIEKGG